MLALARSFAQSLPVSVDLLGCTSVWIAADRYNIAFMIRAIGFVIVLLAIAHIMAEPFDAFQRAVTQTFNVVSLAAVVSQDRLNEFRQ